MERIEELIGRKRQIMAYYKAQLLDMAGASMNYEAPGTVIGAWMPTVVFDESTGVTREQLQAAMLADAIDARVFFHPLSELPMFSPRTQNRWARSIPGRAINLPSYHDMGPAELDRVLAVIRKVVNER
jgi:perosamine synthetase